MRYSVAWAVVATALVLPAVAGAQALVSGVPDSAVLAGLRFRSIGPAVMSGRVADIAVPPATRPGERLGKTIFVATAAGGVWKTTNGGITWAPIFDGQRVSSIGAVAVAPSNPNVVYVGTGEANNLRSSSWGEGVYKSTDAGRTWTHSGLRTSQHIPRIIVHPTNPDIVYVAAMGPLWGAGGERGLFKSTDGGRTWTNTKSLGPYTGFTEVVFDPSNPNTLYAASFQRERKAYSATSGGPESAIWKSTDAGATWIMLSAGLPVGDKGRTGLTVSQSNPNTVYAHIDASEGGIFRSNDGGTTWTRASAVVGPFPWFTGIIRVDPKNPERVYILGQNLEVSNDGGKTFRTIGGSTHADHHAIWIDPNDGDHVMIGNDGGFYISHDAGATWDFALNMPVSTFYAIAVDMRDPYWVYGGLQDNGSFGAPVRTRFGGGIGNEMWVRTGGGDGFYSAVDPTDPDIVYSESQEGSLNRFNLATRESKNIRPSARAGEQLRWNWSTPLLISPHDNKTLYFGANILFRSANRGDSWERVSPDLTRALDRETLPVMGIMGPGGFRRHASTSQFGNLASIDESPVRRGLLYTGSDDGVIAVSRDNGANWTKVTSFPGVPDLTYVSRVIASRHADGTAYATFDGHRSNDFKPYVYKSTDFGRSWTSITSNLPEGSVYVIREHHRDPNLLVVGAEYGVFVTVNGGASWAQLENDIAPAPVHDLVIHPRDNDLVVGTHGRGIYVMEDIGVLERLGAPATAAARTARARLATPKPATVFNRGGGFNLPGNREYAASNAPDGVPLTYYVSAGAGGARGQLVISDAQNRVVRELPAALVPGTHRVQWDLRHDSPVPRDTSAAQPGGRGGRGGRGAGNPENPGAPQFGGGGGTLPGPYVVPGRYTVQLKSGNDVLSQNTIDVRRDPAVRLTVAEFNDLYTERARAYELARRVYQMVARLEAAKRSITAATTGKDASAQPVIQARQVETQIDSALLRLRGAGGTGGRGGRGGGGGATPPNLVAQITGVLTAIGTQHFLPTAAHKQTLTEAAAALQRETARVSELERRAADAVRAVSS
ncbi:MAG: glycosyl hydrolase [Gemmatimonadota bacterium]